VPYVTRLALGQVVAWVAALELLALELLEVPPVELLEVVDVPPQAPVLENFL